MNMLTFNRFTLGLAVAILVTLGTWTTWSHAQSGSTTKGSVTKTEAKDTAEVAGPTIIAVKFHADWCGYCKAMGDVYEEMQAKFDRQPVLWITLDQTREHGRTQAEYLAYALNMKDIWSEHGGKTGFILLVNAETGQVVEKLTHDQTLKQMGAKLVAAVEKAAG